MKRLLATAVVLCAASVALGSTTPPRILASPKAHPAVVRVIVPERGAVSYGSGALVDVDQTLGLVVTNWHVVQDAGGPIMVVFPDGFRSTATLLATDRNWDLAALAIRRPNVRPITLASKVPRRGEPLTIAGYGAGWYKASTGRCTQYVSPGFGLPFEMVELDAAARQGDSGGPIINQRGELAGVLFGTGFGRTAGSHCGRVRQFLGTVAADFQRLSSQSTMIARRPPRNPAPSLDQPAGKLWQRPAPVASITAGPHRLPSREPSGRPAPRYQPLPRQEVDELPIPRPYERPPRSGVTEERPGDCPDFPAGKMGLSPSATVGGGDGTVGRAVRGTRPRMPAGEMPRLQRPDSTLAELVKTVLAGIGVLAVLLQGLRLLGMAAES